MLDGFKKVFKTSLTGTYRLRDLFFIHGANGIKVKPKILEETTWKDDISNDKYSRYIKYLTGGNMAKLWMDFKDRFQLNLLADISDDSAMFDSIQFGRLIRVRSAYQDSDKRVDILNWTDTYYNCIVYTDDRKQTCPICNRLISNIIPGGGKDVILTEYDLAGAVTSLAIPYPRKMYTPKLHLKQCAWLSNNNLAHQESDIEDLISRYGDDGYVECYHFNMQHNHAHWHRYDISKDIRVLSTPDVKYNILDISVGDVILNSYKHIIKDAMKIGQGGKVYFESELYWSCYNILHEFMLPIKVVMENMNAVGRMATVLLMALVHNGVVVKEIFTNMEKYLKYEYVKIGKMTQRVASIQKDWLWCDIVLQGTKFLETEYADFLMESALNNVIPISTSMIHIDKTFLGKDYKVPYWVLTTQPFHTISQVQNDVIKAKRYYHRLHKFIQDELSSTACIMLLEKHRVEYCVNRSMMIDRDAVYYLELPSGSRIDLVYIGLSSIVHGNVLFIGDPSARYIYCFEHKK